jgi:NTE family protein
MKFNIIFVLLLQLFIGLVSGLNQLAFSGGGAFGAVEIGLLKKINELDPKTYDVYTGISAGGLNAGYLSYFPNINIGILRAQRLYSTLKNRDVYSVSPSTGISLLNTDPLRKTVSSIIYDMNSEPAIHTLIGTTNLYSGNLDVFTFGENNNDGKIDLLLATSAIPVVFPPIQYKDSLYADGGTLQNQLLDVVHDNTFLNITYITPSEGYSYNSAPIDDIETMIKRTASIVMSNFNNGITKIYSDCDVPIGQINQYYVPSKALEGYSMLNFDTGDELVKIGYENLQRRTYNIC